MLIMPILSYQCQQALVNGINFMLGGSWFEDSSVGQTGGYLKTEYKNQVLDPIIEHIANQVYNNHSNLGIHFWVLLRFGFWFGELTVYVIFKGDVCRAGANVEIPTIRKGILERLSIRYPRDNNNNNNQQSIHPNTNFNVN